MRRLGKGSMKAGALSHFSIPRRLRRESEGEPAMQTRLDYALAAPEGAQILGRLYAHVARSGLDPLLIDLVYLRVSQINGCSYCVDLHWRDAVEKGADARKLNAVSAWEEMPFFTERERAALGWAESLTLVASTRAPEDAYATVRAQFDDKSLVELSYAIALMNAYNRLGVGFRKHPES